MTQYGREPSGISKKFCKGWPKQKLVMLEAVGGLVLLVAVAQVSTIQLSCKES